MTLIAIGLAGAWLVAVLALLLVLALVRRVNMLAGQVRTESTVAENDLGLNTGESLPDFTVRDLSGSPVASAEVLGDRPALIALLSTTCPSCREQATPFAALGQAASRAGWASVAVVVGDPDDARDLIARLTGSSRVLLADRDDDRLAEDLRLRYFPTFYAVGRDGRVLGREFTARPLRQLVKTTPSGQAAAIQ